MWQYNQTSELCHSGVLGMKWGHRKQYGSTSIRSTIARKQNEKVDEGFKKWNENTKKKENAISLGKKATESKIAYEHDKSNKNLKTQYHVDNKAYKKSIHENTTYRKGVIKKEVGQDLSRKYLSDAKKTKKQLDSDPSNKELKKKYDKLMSKHDVERAKARRAPEIASNRSRKKASIKRTMTMTVKAATATAAVGVGMYAANKYLTNHNVTLNGKNVRVGQNMVNSLGNAVNIGKELFKYV